MSKFEKKICSFCGAEESNEVFLIQGEDSYICSNCIEFCYHMLNKHTLKFEETPDAVFDKFEKEEFELDLTPQMIYKKLGDYVMRERFYQ